MKKNFVKPHKISTHSAHWDNCYFHFFFYWLSDWVSRNSFSNGCWKFHLSILKNKKVFFLKKILSVPWIVLSSANRWPLDVLTFLIHGFVWNIAICNWLSQQHKLHIKPSIWAEMPTYSCLFSYSSCSYNNSN